MAFAPERRESAVAVEMVEERMLSVEMK
jgi:hypothetical protein